jgi:hypothetical protein
VSLIRSEEAVAFETWLATEVFNVAIVPREIVERFAPWQADIEQAIALHGPKMTACPPAFAQVAMECARLLGIGPAAWYQRTGVCGHELQITGDWLHELGLTPRTDGALIPNDSSQCEPVRLAIGTHGRGGWLAAIKSSLGLVGLTPVATRADVFRLCEALRITLPAPIIQPATKSSIILP